MRVTPQGRNGARALLVALHGAGSGGAPGGLWAFRGAWTIPGLVIVAPAAAGSSWTLEAVDVDFVDRALQRAFARCKVDPRRVGVGGFSSGAGMALWLGLSNGDLLRGVRYLTDSARTHSLVMCTRCNWVRFVDGLHFFARERREEVRLLG
jgi:poly(3-hydroxybutyrate) depolymerase